MGENFGPFQLAQRADVEAYMEAYYGHLSWVSHDLVLPPPCYIQNKTSLEVRGPMAWHEAVKMAVGNYHFVDVTSKCPN